MELDPDFHATASTINRFQYLADLTGQKTTRSFLPLGLVAAVSSQDQGVIEIAELINASSQSIRLTSLQATVSAGGTQLADATLFTSNPLVIPPDTTYIARLRLGKPPADWSTATRFGTFTYDFHWDSTTP